MLTEQRRRWSNAVPRFILAVIVVFLSIGFPSVSSAIPTQISYQGTLKERGIPVNGTRTMQFRIINQTGSTMYWTSGPVTITVVNGLFSTTLNPTGVNWQAITPYMEVSVNGQALGPAEPINASIYANISADIADGAITPAKIAGGTGLILMFAGPCPPGWTRFTALDGKFPLGDSNFGTTGGAATHTHNISNDGNHDHSGSTAGATRSATSIVGTPAGAGPGQYLEDVANQPNERASYHTHGIQQGGTHNHSGSTGISGNIPPFVSVVFCTKS